MTTTTAQRGWVPRTLRCTDWLNAVSCCTALGVAAVLWLAFYPSELAWWFGGVAGTLGVPLATRFWLFRFIPPQSRSGNHWLSVGYAVGAAACWLVAAVLPVGALHAALTVGAVLAAAAAVVAVIAPLGPPQGNRWWSDLAWVVATVCALVYASIALSWAANLQLLIIENGTHRAVPAGTLELGSDRLASPAIEAGSHAYVVVARRTGGDATWRLTAPGVDESAGYVSLAPGVTRMRLRDNPSP